jgi:hypothetical protein
MSIRRFPPKRIEKTGENGAPVHAAERSGIGSGKIPDSGPRRPM